VAQGSTKGVYLPSHRNLRLSLKSQGNLVSLNHSTRLMRNSMGRSDK